MRLVALELAGFRGFAEMRRFDLDATAIILVGPNGQGKTSLFDAVLWVLTGHLARLGENAQAVSLYSSSGEARVSVDMRDEDNEVLKVTRSSDGTNQRLLVEHHGEILRDEIARTRLLEVVWPEALVTPDGLTALSTAITRSVYLQQDLVREFIEADTDQDRFKAVGELVGAGRVTELQTEIERARNAWSRATNSRQREAEEARVRLQRLETQLISLSSGTEALAEIGVGWASWWNQAQRIGVGMPQIPDAGSSEALTAMDETIRQLEGLRRTHERRLRLAEELLVDIQARQDQVPQDVSPLQENLSMASRDVADAETALTEAAQRAAEERRLLLQLRDAREEIRGLAQLALRHLGDTCPVCGQTYDRDSTREHLEELIGADTVDADSTLSGRSVGDFAAGVEEKRQARSRAERELRAAEESSREHSAWMAERDRRLHELGLGAVPEPGTAQSLTERQSELAARLQALDQLRESGEALVLSLARLSEQARRAEVEFQVMDARRETADLAQLVVNREETGQLASRILDSLREATYDVVQEEIDRIGPLLQRIYASVDPHPAFRAVRFLTRVSRGQGHLSAMVDDPLAQVSLESPSSVLSSSQMNALAVAVFLSFNLGMPTVPLDVALLDDPLQSLDDVNLLGLIDLLRRTRAQRQLIVSTHDSRFGKLLERKLRPVSEQDRTLVIEFDGWNREGPTTVQREVARETQSIRIVA